MQNLVGLRSQEEKTGVLLGLDLPLAGRGTEIARIGAIV